MELEQQETGRSDVVTVRGDSGITCCSDLTFTSDSEESEAGSEVTQGHSEVTLASYISGLKVSSVA